MQMSVLNTPQHKVANEIKDLLKAIESGAAIRPQRMSYAKF